MLILISDFDISMIMNKIIFKLNLILLMIISNNVAVNANSIDSLEIIFNESKKEYLIFEKEHGNYIQTDNIFMHYLTWGDKSGVPLVWLHGSLNHCYELSDIADELTSAGYYLIAVDYYGHGKTPMPIHEVSLYHIADDIKILLDSLHIEKSIIGGFSRGGYIASAFYDSYPDRVLGLILEDGGSVAFNSYNHRMPDEDLQNKASLMKSTFEIEALYHSEYESEFEAFKSLYDFEKGGLQFELFSIINKKETKWVTYKDVNETFHMKDSAQFMDLVLRPERVSLYAASIGMIQPKVIFRNLKVPMLVLDPVSVNDDMPFEAENIALQNMHPNLITRKEYINTDHNIHYEHPKRFTQDLIEFLRLIM